MRVSIVAFTARGAELAARLCTDLGPDCEAHAVARYAAAPVQPLNKPLGEWTAERFQRGGALVFIGAAAIAVRAVIPLAKGKATDPAVLCIDEAGRWVIPLLSGHLGGANLLARELAALCGGEAVITTATDVNGVFAADTWAAGHGCVVADTGEIKHISAAVLDGETVGLSTEFPIKGPLPQGVVQTQQARCGIEIAFTATRPYDHTLQLIPRCIVAGIGCRKGAGADAINRIMDAALEQHGLPRAAVGMVASIDLKANEPGLLEVCRQLNTPLHVFTAERLLEVEGEFTPSKWVEKVTGVDNVCERAAVVAAGEDCKLIAPKAAADGVTVALAQKAWKIEF